MRQKIFMDTFKHSVYHTPVIADLIRNPLKSRRCRIKFGMTWGVFRSALILFALLFMLTGQQAKAQEVSFRAIAPEAVIMGEQFRLVFTVNREGMEFRAPDLNEFDVLMGPSKSVSSSTQFVNGQSSSVFTQTHTYILMPKKEGTYNLAPATIRVNNANYTSNALVIKVLPPDSNPPATQQGGAGNSGSTQSSSGGSNEDLYVRLSVSNRSVYEQEGLLVTIKLFSLVDAQPVNYKFPEFEGFLEQAIDLNSQWVFENIDGRNYRTAILKQSIIYPQRSGKITIGSGKIELNVRVPTQRRVRSIFDDFFDTYSDVRREITSNPVTIDVKPLPPGRPASFSGAVGNYTMDAKINSNKVKANEAVTITVKFTGSGNIRLLRKPEVIFPNDFEAFDPKESSNIRTTAQGTSGTKTIEYTAIPRFAGDFEIPAIQFSYFDPRDETYKTLRSDPFKILVERGVGDDGTASPIISNFSNQESLKYLGQDIRYIKLISKPRFIQNNEMFFGSFTYLLVYLIVTVLFIAFFLIYRKQVRENANIALVRTRKANKTAVRRLKTAEKLLKENRKEEFYEEVLRALWGYLSDKLNIPQAKLTKDNVEAELAKYGVGEELSREFMEILHTCEFARYAPAQASDAMDILFKQTVNAIGKMENTIKK